MKELELISLRTLIPLIASISNFNELKNFIEEKMMPLFSFEHYVLWRYMESSEHYIEIHSFTSSAAKPNQKENREHLQKYLKTIVPGHIPVTIALKPTSAKLNEVPECLVQAYNAHMREAVFFPVTQVNTPCYWVLFSSKKEFFNPFKQELFNTLQVLVGMALDRCIVESSSTLISVNDIAIDSSVKETRPITEDDTCTLNKTTIIGDSAEMQVVKNLIAQSAPSDSTILILGETGTGKELVARAIHEHSSRKDQLMIVVNCAALPPELIESELFGHEKGSFTGAVERKLGRFELANNSTIFLDEIGELPLSLQAKLLRVLQERVIERLGGQRSISVNVRIIAATNRNLQTEVVAGRFRSDLYYRLNVFPILLPALRERPYDLKALTHFFVDKFSTKFERPVTDISQQAWHALHQYTWPGNVRELEHTIERSLLLHQGKILKQIHFVSQTISVVDAVRIEKCSLTLKEMEREYILKAIRQCNGRVSGKQGAAALLGLPATTLFSKMEKLGIKKTLLSAEITTY